jgi:general secretion pathway protein A
MYTKHFGLEKLPFENVPDPAFFFDEGDHARIHNRITESLKAGRGLTVVTGHIGAGKTTLSQMVISEFSDDVKLIWMAEPPENSIDLFLFIAQELGLKPESSEKTFILRDIKDALQKINAEGRKCLVIIDESHLVSDDTINGIRLLNNLEEGSKKLIQILLLGQEELAEIINRPDMEPFRQRIATLETLGKMDTERIRKYVAHRIHVAGGGPSMLADTGWEALALAFGSGSTPRVINSLCDRSLNAAFEREKTIVDVDDVYEAAQGMGLQKEIFFYKVALRPNDSEGN